MALHSKANRHTSKSSESSESSPGVHLRHHKFIPEHKPLLQQRREAADRGLQATSNNHKKMKHSEHTLPELHQGDDGLVSWRPPGETVFPVPPTPCAPSVVLAVLRPHSTNADEKAVPVVPPGDSVARSRSLCPFPGAVLCWSTANVGGAMPFTFPVVNLLPRSQSRLTFCRSCAGAASPRLSAHWAAES